MVPPSILRGKRLSSENKVNLETRGEEANGEISLNDVYLDAFLNGARGGTRREEFIRKKFIPLLE